MYSAFPAQGLRDGGLKLPWLSRSWVRQAELKPQSGPIGLSLSRNTMEASKMSYTSLAHGGTLQEKSGRQANLCRSSWIGSRKNLYIHLIFCLILSLTPSHCYGNSLGWGEGRESLTLIQPAVVCALACKQCTYHRVSLVLLTITHAPLYHRAPWALLRSYPAMLKLPWSPPRWC